MFAFGILAVAMVDDGNGLTSECMLTMRARPAGGLMFVDTRTGTSTASDMYVRDCRQPGLPLRQY